MAVLQIMLVAFVGMAAACTTRGRNGQPVVDSGSVEIPIRLQFQQGPIPSASVSVGIESKMNQNLGNGQYRQTQFNGGFELQGAAVPVLDGDANIQGVRADLDTRVSHDQRVVLLNHDPMVPTQKPNNGGYAAQGAQAGNQQQQQAQQRQPVQNQPEVPAQRPNVVRTKPLRLTDYDDVAQSKSTTQQAGSIAGLKQEYFIAIMCVSSACFIVLVIVMIIVARKKQQVVEHINSIHRRIVTRPATTYSAPVYLGPSELIVDQKPPSYDSETMKTIVKGGDSRRSSSTMSDYEKKY